MGAEWVGDRQHVRQRPRLDCGAVGMIERCDVVVVGGGIIGLATAMALQEMHASLDIVIIEKERRLGWHQTGHNSGVLHSGLYYRPGSLKARLCVEGRGRMLDFCRDQGLPLRVSGKLVVASTAQEVGRLDDLRERGIANGLKGIERLGADGIRDHEPYATGVAALWVPGTGVVDFSAIAIRMGELLDRAGAVIRTGAGVDEIEVGDDGVVVSAGDWSLRARVVLNTAGLHADRVARMSGVEPPARIIPFRGEYHVLAEDAAALVKGLIYPVPDPRFPFLGVHFTRRVDGSVEVGPNAVLAIGREHYRGTRAQWSGLVEALGCGGFRRLAARHLVSGMGEMMRSRSRRLYARRARRLVPGLSGSDLHPGDSGIRAQAVFPDGTIADDFVIAGEGPMLHVISAPSPAATAALAVGEHLAGLVLGRMP